MHYESGLLVVDASGEFSLKEAKRAFVEMLEAVTRYQVEKILCDCRKLKGEPRILERFFYGEFAAEETMKLVTKHRIVPRFAYVLHEPLRDPEGFGETVAVNRGMYVKVFESPTDAARWLDRPRANKTGHTNEGRKT